MEDPFTLASYKAFSLYTVYYIGIIEAFAGKMNHKFQEKHLILSIEVVLEGVWHTIWFSWNLLMPAQ